MAAPAKDLSPKILAFRDSTERKFVRSDGNLGITTTADIERARFITESMKETEGMNQTYRWAKAFENYCAKKTIFIIDSERFAGWLGHDQHSIPFYLELWPKKVLYGAIGSKMALTEEEWAELDEIEEYWKGKSFEEQVTANYPDKLREEVYPGADDSHFNAVMASTSVVYRWNQSQAFTDLPRLFKLGTNGIKAQLEETLKRVEDEMQAIYHDASKTADLIERRWNTKAMLVALEAGASFVERYAALAREKAAVEDDPVRKAELLEMAEACQIREPAKSFRNALQTEWFDSLFMAMQSMGYGPSKRLDQTLYPYYKADIDAGKITRDDALEMIEEVWLRYERVMGKLEPAANRAAGMGSSTLLQNITLGGVDPKTGRDATNDLTYLMIEASTRMQTVQPTLSLRIHPGTPDELLAKAWECIKTGIGYPALLNDLPTIEYAMMNGWSLEDARNNSVSGCILPVIDNKNVIPQLTCAGGMNVAKGFEVALNHGVDMLTGEQLWGIDPGGPDTYKSLDDIMEGYRKIVVENYRRCWAASQITRVTDSKIYAMPFSSAMNEKCCKEGLDCRKIADYNNPFFGCMSGIIDVVDSLAVIRKLVYEDKKYTLQEIVDAMKANFEGYDQLYQDCLDVPKFGQGDDYVDDMAQPVYDMFQDEAKKFIDFKGNWYGTQYQSVSTFVFFGSMTAALPCGRKARMPLSDGGISPEAGWGKDPTRVLKGVSKVDASKNQRMLQNMRLTVNTTTAQFINLVRTWSDLECSWIQFNVVDNETLKDAQKTPDDYQDLIVRIAGYSAVFVYLPEVAQDAIIARSEQEF